jgi:hypothetical protein
VLRRGSCGGARIYLGITIFYCHSVLQEGTRSKKNCLCNCVNENKSFYEVFLKFNCKSTKFRAYYCFQYLVVRVNVSFVVLVREERKDEYYYVGGLCYFRQQDGRWRSRDPPKCRLIFTRLNVVTMSGLWQCSCFWLDRY